MTEERKAEKFGTTDYSVTAPFLKRLVSEQVLKILPGFYSPNALTLTGGFFATLSALIIWSFATEMRSGSDAGKFWMMTSAILLIIYAVFDQLDGMQARKLGRSSPFGDFLDHWVDTIIANAMTVPIMVMLQVEQSMIWLMAFVTSLAFWAHNWETRNTNYRRLPLVGGLESIWTALVVMTLTSIYGVEIWQRSWFGVSLLLVFYWLGLSALLWVVIKSLLTSRIRWADYWGFIIALLPISVWLLLMASGYQESNLFVYVGYITMGFMATLLTGNLMRHQWLGGDYQRFEPVTPILGLLVLIAGVSNIGASVMSVLECGLISLICVIAIGRVIYQGIHSYRVLMKVQASAD